MVNRAQKRTDRSATSILNLVKQVQYKAFLRLENIFQPHGITAVQFRILTTVSTREGLTSADLARIYDVKPQSMIRQIALLESKGLVQRAASNANKRLLKLSLTAKGTDCLDTCHRAAEALEDQILSPLAPEQRDQLRDALQELQQSLSGSAPQPGGEPELEELSQEYRRVGVQRV